MDIGLVRLKMVYTIHLICIKRALIHNDSAMVLVFLEAKFRGRGLKDSPRTSVLKKGAPPLSKTQIWPIIGNNLETVRDRM